MRGISTVGKVAVHKIIGRKKCRGIQLHTVWGLDCRAGELSLSAGRRANSAGGEPQQDGIENFIRSALNSMRKVARLHICLGSRLATRYDMQISQQRTSTRIADGTELEPLLDEVEFSRITGRSVASARRDRLLGRGCPHIKLGALVRYRPSDVRDYIERNRKSTA